MNQGGLRKGNAFGIGQTDEGDAGDHGVRAPGKLFEHPPRVVRGARLTEDLAVERAERRVAHGGERRMVVLPVSGAEVGLECVVVAALIGPVAGATVGVEDVGGAGIGCDADLAMDAAACIGCGACVAACPNASAMLFVAAKVSHLGLLPQGQPERDTRVVGMVAQMDAEGFGACTNHGECMAACPKEISIDFIAQLNRDYWKTKLAPKPQAKEFTGAA